MDPIEIADARNAEDELRSAMLGADVNALDRLLAPTLIFTNHLGRVLSKEDDLAAHRSGILKVKELVVSEQVIRIVGPVAIVSAKMQLSGTYDGGPADGGFRFTRVWARSGDGTLQLVAAHSTAIA